MKIGIDVGVLREPARGVGNYLLNILTRMFLLTQGDEFFLYSPNPIIYNLSGLVPTYLRYGTISLPGTIWLQTQGKNYIKKDKIEVFFAPAHILPLRLPNRIRKVLAVHDLVSILYPETMANYNRFVHNLFFKQSVKSADHIITMSEFTKQSIINYFNISKEKITVIYEGVNDIFKAIPKEKMQNILRRYGIYKPYILAVGTLEPRKNYQLLLQAFRNLTTDYDLVIIGKHGWKVKNIFKTILDLRIENRVKILGYIEISDLPYFYNGAELFIFPSFYEGFGLPILEAMACGTPVISSDASSLPEVGGDAVIYFNPNSVDELTFNIQRLLDSNQLRKSLKEKALTRAKKFSWDKTAQKTLSIIKGLSVNE